MLRAALRSPHPHRWLCASSRSCSWVAVTVLFCDSCGYGRHAQKLAETLKDSGAAVLTDGRGAVGSYEVSAAVVGSTGGSVSLWSKRATGEPSTPQAFLALNSLLQSELRQLRRLHEKLRQPELNAPPP